VNEDRRGEIKFGRKNMEAKTHTIVDAILLRPVNAISIVDVASVISAIKA